MSIEELLTLAKGIKDKGDMVFIKLDGERENNQITIIISYPNDKGKEQIRYEGDDLNECLFKAINSYYHNDL